MSKIKEVALWRAVILQAIQDLLTESKRTEEKNARNSALCWLDINNKDFIIVCYLAGLNPEFVLRKVRDGVINQSKWRRKCDIGKGVEYVKENMQL